MTTKNLIARLSERILNTKTSHPLRIAIDGVSTSGKTTLADALAIFLRACPASAVAQKKPVIRASIDGFHNPKEIRYKRGQNSPEGYYKDSFDNKAIVENLLAPLGPNGNLRYKKAIFNFRTDSKVDSLTLTAKKDSILIMDGIFLMRPELVGHFDLKILLLVNEKTVLSRAINRDSFLGPKEEILKKYALRYTLGEKLYFEDAKPTEKADIVIDNNDFENPEIVKI